MLKCTTGVDFVSLCGLTSSCVSLTTSSYVLLPSTVSQSVTVGKPFKNNKALTTQFKFNFTNYLSLLFSFFSGKVSSRD